MLQLDDVWAPRPPPRPVIRRDLSVPVPFGKVVDPVVELGQRGRGVSKGRVAAVGPPYRMVEVVAHGNSGRPAPPRLQSSYVGSKRRAEDRPPPATTVRVSEQAKIALERHQVTPFEVPVEDTVALSAVPPERTDATNGRPRSLPSGPEAAPERIRGWGTPPAQPRLSGLVALGRVGHAGQSRSRPQATRGHHPVREGAPCRRSREPMPPSLSDRARQRKYRGASGCAPPARSVRRGAAWRPFAVRRDRRPRTA